MEDETLELFRLLSRGHKLKIYPGSHLPADAEFQVCTNHPVEGGGNLKSVCSKCDCPIFFQDNHPHLKKICVRCFLNFAKNHEVESIGNVDSIIKASLVRKRN